MSCPHVAGIVALMLEANPSLSPGEIKNILQETATNIPNKEPREVGAGYVNTYALLQEENLLLSLPGLFMNGLHRHWQKIVMIRKTFQLH